jgi:hypothetical protein
VVVQQPQEARRRAGCGAVGGVESRLVDALLSRSERDGEGGCHVAARNFGLGLGEGRLLFPYFYIHRVGNVHTRLRLELISVAGPGPPRRTCI